MSGSEPSPVRQPSRLHVRAGSRSSCKPPGPWRPAGWRRWSECNSANTVSLYQPRLSWSCGWYWADRRGSSRACAECQLWSRRCPNSPYRRNPACRGRRSPVSRLALLGADPNPCPAAHLQWCRSARHQTVPWRQSNEQPLRPRCRTLQLSLSRALRSFQDRYHEGHEKISGSLVCLSALCS